MFYDDQWMRSIDESPGSPLTYHRTYIHQPRKQQELFIPPWVFEGVSGCVMEPIRASPSTEAYRNKSEFTVGLDAEGRPTVGFRVGTYKVSWVGFFL